MRALAEDEGRDAAAGQVPTTLDVLALFFAALLLLVVIGSLTQRYRPGPVGVALTELLAILLPALVWSRAQNLRFHPLLVPRSPRALPRLALSGLLLGASWFYLMGVFVEPLLERVYPMPPWERRQLMQLLLPPLHPRPLWLDLSCFALAPAVCEELLFRGVFLPALLVRLARVLPPRSPSLLGRSAAPVLALFVTSLLFGAFHLSCAKFLPTFALSLGFGGIVLASGSLWPAIAMHFCNNALVILLLRAGLEQPPGPSGSGWAWLAGAAAGAVLGAILLIPARKVVVPT